MKILKARHNINIAFHGKSIEQTKNVKYPGVMLSSSWKQEVDIKDSL